MNNVLTILLQLSVVLQDWVYDQFSFKKNMFLWSKTHCATPNLFNKDSKINEAGFEFFGFIIDSADSFRMWHHAHNVTSFIAYTSNIK